MQIFRKLNIAKALAGPDLIDNYLGTAYNFLFKFNQANGATAIPVDRCSSGDAPSISCSGGASISTEKSFFGSGSLKLDGSTGYANTSWANDGFAFGTGDFCVEIAAYPTIVDGTLRYIWGKNESSVCLSLYHKNGFLGINLGDINLNYLSDLPIILNAWNFISVRRKSGKVTMHNYYNGEAHKANFPSSPNTTMITNITLGASANSSLTRKIILGNTAYGNNYFAGYLDYFSNINGNSKYNGDIVVPPTSEI